MGGHFLGGISTIVALFLKKILGAFWRFPAQNVALPNSKQLDTLFSTRTATSKSILLTEENRNSLEKKYSIKIFSRPS